jgi:MFS family permease
MTSDRFRHLWAVLRNAITWGVAWALAGGAIVTVLSLFSPGPIGSLFERIGMSLLAGMAWGVRFGIAGSVIGSLFSTIILLGYRGRRLADISPWRFGLLGAVVGGVGVPLFLQMMNVLSGDGAIAWRLVWDDGIWASVFGGVAAAGSILLARHADALSRGSDPEELEGFDPPDGTLTAGKREASLSRSSRSTQK